MGIDWVWSFMAHALAAIFVSVTREITRISREFPVEFGFFSGFLAFFVGTLAGKFFYDKRDLLGSAVIGCALLLFGFVFWLI